MNAALELGPPPEDPKGQLEWLANALKALEGTKDRKVRPLKKRLSRLMFQFQRSVDRGDSNEQIAGRIGPEINGLLSETFRTLSKTLDQVIGTMRVKQARGTLGASPTEMSKLIAEIKEGATQFEAFASAIQSGNQAQMSDAQARLTHSAERLKDPVAAMA